MNWINMGNIDLLNKNILVAIVFIYDHFTTNKLEVKAVQRQHHEIQYE